MQKRTLMNRRSFVKAATMASVAVAAGSSLISCSPKTDETETQEQTTGAEAVDPVSINTDELYFYNSTCHGCIQACPVKVYLRDGVVVKIEGHPDAPTSQGSICLKCLNQIHTCYSPRRILYPMHRTSAKGAENATFERVSWDEAADLGGSMIADTMEKYGTYSLMCSSGGGGMYGGGGPTQKFISSFYATDIFEPGCSQCLLPREQVGAFTWGHGSQSIADVSVLEPFKGFSKADREAGIENETSCLVIWGTQPSVSQVSQSGRAIAELRAKGCKTIVVDPNFSPDATKATIHLPVRPGSDCALILSWYRVILDEELYDVEFTKYYTDMPFLINPDTMLPWLATEVFDDYTPTTPDDTPVYVCVDEDTNEVVPLPFGFAEDIAKTVNPKVLATATVNGKESRSAGQIYRDEADPWTLERAEEFCWVPQDRIRAAIDLYTNPPTGVAGIAHGVATDQMEISSQAPLGLQGLDLIMGYVYKPGCTMTSTGGGMGAVSPGPDGTYSRPTGYCGVGGMLGTGFGVGYQIGAGDAVNEAFVNSVADSVDPDDPDADPWFTKQGQEIYRHLMMDRLGMDDHRGIYYWLMAHIPSIREGIETGEPHHCRCWYDMSGNKLAMLGSAGAWYNACINGGIDYYIGQYPNMTSMHMEFADLVLPTQEWLEATDAANSQMNFSFPSPGIIHLGETVPFAVPFGKVYCNAIDKLNERLDKVVFTGTGETIAEMGLTFPFGAGLSGGGGMMGYNTSEDECWASQIATFGEAAGCGADATKEEFMEAAKNNPDVYVCTTPSENYWVYNQHLIECGDGLPLGFQTVSRRAEPYATGMIRLSQTGWPYVYPFEFDPVDSRKCSFNGFYAPICVVPRQREAPEVENSDGFIDEFDPDFPYALTSGRMPHFHHNTMRHAPFARELAPAPYCRINSRTAAELGIENGDWVEISSRRTQGEEYDTTGKGGKEMAASGEKAQNTKVAEPIHAVAYVSEMVSPKVVWMERFWNPECFDSSVPKEQRTGGWAECNVNVLTNAIDTNFNEAFGSYNNRAFAVNIKKSEKPANVWSQPKEFEPFLPTNANEYVEEIGVLMENSDMLTDTVKFE